MKKTLLPLIALVLFGVSSFAQWEVLSSGVTASLNSVFFIDQNNGYAVGNMEQYLKQLMVEQPGTVSLPEPIRN